MRRGQQDKGSSSAEMRAFLGEGTRFSGTVVFEGVIRIDGDLDGKVISENGTIIIGSKARIKAEMSVGVAEIEGAFESYIKATTAVRLNSTAKMKGNIVTPLIGIEEGAEFNGSCSMGKGEEEPFPESDSDKEVVLKAV